MPKLIPPSDALALQQGSNPHLIAALSEEKTEWAFEGHGFFIHNFGLLIPNNLHCEIIEQLSLCAMPHTQTWFHGMANLRGGIVPVFDLQQILGFRPISNQIRKQKLLVIHTEDEPLGILIDKLPTRIRLTPQQRLTPTPSPPGKLASFCSDFFKRECIWIAWDIEHFFEANTQRNVVQIM